MVFGDSRPVARLCATAGLAVPYGASGAKSKHVLWKGSDLDKVKNFASSITVASSSRSRNSVRYVLYRTNSSFVFQPLARILAAVMHRTYCTVDLLPIAAAGVSYVFTVMRLHMGRLH